MPRTPTFPGDNLTVHHPAARRYLGPPISSHGYTAMDLWKFYGLVAGFWCTIALIKVRYEGLFDDLASKSMLGKVWVVILTLPPLLFALPVVFIFLWWLAGALVRYSKWQVAQASLWRPFWLAMLMFYAWVLIDPLNNIHPVMARKGLAAAPNLIEIVGNGLFDGSRLRPADDLLFQFQWGYSLLLWLFWFLIFVLHWQYLTDGLREVWFYTNRFRRYGVSVLTGFNETARMAGTLPVTRDYPRIRPVLPETYRGVPRLNVDRLTAEEAQAILAADASGALSSAPGQPTVLFLDLGRYDFSPALAELRRADGKPLLSFANAWPTPETRREDLVVPLSSGGAGGPARRFEDAGTAARATEQTEASDD